MADRDNRRELAERFGRNVFRARRRAGLSQEDLRIRTALHRTQIGMVERGLRLSRLDTIIKLAGGIEVDPRQLLDGLSWSPAEVGPGRFYVVGEGGLRSTWTVSERQPKARHNSIPRSHDEPRCFCSKPRHQ